MRVAAGVLVVALAHLVGYVLEAVAGIHVAHEALRPAARGAGEFAGLAARQLLTL